MEDTPIMKCEVCDIQFTAASNLETHLNGKKHASRKRSFDKGDALSTAKNDQAKGDPNMKCEICDIQFTAASNLETHLNGKKHASRKRSFEKGDALSTAKNDQAKGDPNLKCEICDIQFTSTSTLETHFNGKKHVSRKRSLDEGNPLPTARKSEEKCDPDLKCKTCDIQFTSTSILETHLNGKKHVSRKRALDEGNTLPTANRVVEGSKKSKVKDEIKSGNVKCEVCNIEFTNCDMAVQHFKGKKHRSQIIKNMQAKLPQKKSKTGWKGRGGAAGKRWSPNNYASENAMQLNNVQSFKPFGNGIPSKYFTEAAGHQNVRSQLHTQRFEGGHRSMQHMQNINGGSNRVAKDKIYEREFEENIQSMMPNSRRNPGGNDYTDNGTRNNGPSYGNRGVGNDNNPNNYEYNGGGNFSDDRDEHGGNYRQTSRHYCEDGRNSDGNNSGINPE